jgi:UDP-N-acetyl-D-glucosamine dehydrogenase
MLEKTLTQVIQDRSATIGVMGLGYVGLPLSLLFVKAGFKVIGYDINQTYVAALQQGNSGIIDVPSTDLKEALSTGRFLPTHRTEDLVKADIYLICVPTPLSKTRQPDLSYIQGAVDTVLNMWTPGKLLVLESTTYPGTTDEMLLPLLSGALFTIDQDFLLAFSPERVDPGNRNHPLASIPKVVGGVTAASTRVAAALYQTAFERVHEVSSARAAELSKLLENTFRNVNIALANEFAQICDSLGVNPWEVIEAANTKPFGFMAFYPGPGIGGHCIPLDPQYLVYKARLSGYEPRLVALADHINQEMPRYSVQKTMELLNEQGKALKGAKVLLAGVAYKADVPDLRESPALVILEQLLKRGAEVSYTDPFVKTLKLEDGHMLTGIPLNRKTLEQADAILLTTAHKRFDYTLLSLFKDKLIDTRNALQNYNQQNYNQQKYGQPEAQVSQHLPTLVGNAIRPLTLPG